MITFHLVGSDEKINQKRVKELIKQLPKTSYYHFFFEPSLIIRIHNKDKKYLADYCDKKKWKYRTYIYPITKNGYGESKKSMTYIYRDEFIPLLHITSRLALKAKKKDKKWIAERYYHTFMNELGLNWEDEAQLSNWLLRGRINTFKYFYGDGAIISLICLLIIWLTNVNKVLIKGLT